MAADKKEVADDTILLISSDGEHFNVPSAAASLSQLVSNMIENDCTTNGVPLPNVASKVLAKVIEYCVKHAAAAEDEEKELKSFDAEFMIDVDKNMLYGLLLASNFLNIKSLLDLCCQHTANLIKGKSPEQIRKEFGIKNDFTPEEEEIRKENTWAFE
ncbi:SKP1-like protein 5 [Oryza sativa Japonica Group]|uniref:SKP1-like protein n=3 Tax=Oryza sativa TaxID=4530 RepID=A0A0P0X261_ORYSJ|nr:SKP1-like protein 1B [Oryza sativa Japonica Group]EAZ02758.1 hypothetical protein OsI_24878 [Oryza sativa Indica Group]BAC19968.1 putative Skp1 [Oryza sativa Japonica Group]BAD31468.1 putative Skp1 [Oryza sativa Japonica Group]BAT00038.1 Os07g0144800 [Oryza sativa Japonica Group]